MSENMISVTEYSTYIKQIFASEEILHNISVYGEVSGFSVSRGTAYFNIKDSESLLPCVSFGVEGFPYIPKDGDMVIVVGSPNYYSKGGKLSFVAREIKAYGLGILNQQFLEMKQKLEKEGLFDAKNKKPLPKHITKIGVVTSQTGAVIQDIIDVSHRRNPMLNILLYPAKVQGLGAEQTICDGIYALDQTDVDLIIVARGGGSLEDLSPFNTEVVARAIFAAQKPVISAVGHETDFTIADFVSDLRAPTPSAAAEIVSVDMGVLIERFEETLQKIEERFDDKLQTCFENVLNSVSKIAMVADRMVSEKQKPLDKLLMSFAHVPEKMMQLKEQTLNLLTNKIELNNPLSIIKRGYVTAEHNGKRVTSVCDVEIDEEIKLSLIDGSLMAKITNKEKI